MTAVRTALPAAHVTVAGAPSGVSPSVSAASIAKLAAEDPSVLSRLARERYADVRDYRCTFLKQELINGKLTPVQEIRVLYRENPHSVYMTWVRNPDQARRALYVAGRYTGRRGEPLALVEPAGSVIRLLVKSVKVPIHGKQSQQASRRSIDQFGFRSTLDLLDAYNRVAEEQGVLRLAFEGSGEIDGRPTFILSRVLPYTGPACPYPDARMEIHFDQETLLPVAVYSWADEQEKQLLGSYVITQVELNPGLTDADFAF